MSIAVHTNDTTKIDTLSPIPLYFQLKQILLNKLRNGEIAPGEAIPSERELEEMYGVSRITIRRALSELASEGLISRLPGRGSFVLQPKAQDRSGTLGGFVDNLIDQGYHVESTILERDVHAATPSIAAKLGIGDEDPILHYVKLILANSEPIALARCFFNLPDQVALSDEDLQLNSIYPLLEEKFGIAIRRGERTIEATLASMAEAQILQINSNAPLLLAELLVFDNRNNPIGFIKTLYRGDRYKYFSELSR